MTIFHWAADRGHLAIFEHWFPILHIPVDEQDINGNTALLYAVMTENIEIASFLKGQGASCSIRNNDGLCATDFE
jgi:ankyrin repeat protein